MAEVRCPYLVGRDEQLATLRAGLAAARDGRGGMVFLSGEPGVGKSRLARELAGLADPAPVLVGRAVPAPGAAAYRPLAEALAQALRGRDLPDDPDLAPWLPALRVLLPVPGAAPADAVEATAHVCGEALVRVLRRVGGGRALVAILEDLHWADPDTLGVLEYLADNLAAEPVLCLGTLRDEPATPALDLARRVSQRGAGGHLRLSRLADAEVATMVAACAPEAGTEVVERVRATADGVPLFVEEVLATPGVPASVGEAVRTRVGTLDETAREVLYAAAVLGRDFDWELLPAVTGAPVGQVTAALEQAVAAMLVSVDGDGFRFRHALTREAVVAMLVPPRRTSVARAALAALDRVAPDHAHADLALQAGDRARAGSLLAASGRAALRRGALGTAVQALQRSVGLRDDPIAGRPELVAALALAGRLDEALAVGEQLLGQLGADPATAAAVHLELARAAVAATRRPTAISHLDAARSLLAAGLGTAGADPPGADPPGADPPGADAPGGDAPGTGARGAEASGVDGPGPALAAQADVLAAEIALADDELDRAREAAQRALAAAGRAGAPETRCHALELIGRSHRVRDLDAAREAFGRAYQCADAAGLPVWRLRALHELGTVDLLDHAGTDTLHAAREQAEQLGAHSTAAVLDVQLAAAYHLRFDLDAAHAHARRAVAQSRRLHLAGTHAVAQFFDAGTSALRGDREATEAAAAETLRVAQGDPEFEGYVWAGATGLLELLWGDRDAALAALDRGMAALHTVARSAPGQYRGLWALLHAVAGRPDAADRVAQVRASGVTVMRPNAGFLHYAEAVLGRASDPVAAGDAELAYAPVWRQLGRMLVAEAALAGGWGSPQQWLREARGCFEDHRLHHLARHCARLLAEPLRWAPAGLTPREAEVLRLVATGLANKQIATRLQLSVRTVEKHVESVLRKAGAGSRTQLVAMVGETT